MEGLAALEAALSASPRVRVILLDASGDSDAGVVALEKGAAGYLSRELELTSIARAVARVAAGEAAISRSMSARLIERLRSRSTDTAGLRPIKSVLTTREWEVLDLMTAGASSAEIARSTRALPRHGSQPREPHLPQASRTLTRRSDRDGGERASLPTRTSVHH